jgi:hypothetical protein
LGHQDDSGTETMTKKSDDKSAKKGGAPASLTVPKEAGAKSATGKETRAGNNEYKKTNIYYIYIKLY